jgi:tRNA (mo5U34)-methyltransferase
VAADIWTNPEGQGPGPNYPDSRWQLIEPLLPDVSGKSCLDIGCSSGFFSLKLKELGASYVLGIDAGEQPKAIQQASFSAATLRLDVDFRVHSVYDLSGLGRQFDVVLFMGVLYHLRHPLLALEAIRSICRETLILQTITTAHHQAAEELSVSFRESVGLRSPVLDDERFPTLKFIEGGLDGDVTCWFVPNTQAVRAMLRSSGFVIDKSVFSNDPEVIARCRPGS